MGRQKGCIGHWSMYKYTRRGIGENVKSFCGWNKLEKLVKSAVNIEVGALLCTLFETGGRAKEVLKLTGDQFEIVDESFIEVKDMVVLKSHQSSARTRNVPIPLDEPLVEPMVEWIKRRGKGKLFPRTYAWLYKWITKTDPNWWPHRFRSERASQLVQEYDYRLMDLKKWFGWSTDDMAQQYAKLSTAVLRDRMLIAKQRRRKL